ncbi:MAG: hypothetical protein O0X49_05175, partial [Methanocorpusculum sp.]|nr:hypothetical protein [Methanocorpusculum sp.]
MADDFFLDGAASVPVFSPPKLSNQNPMRDSEQVEIFGATPRTIPIFNTPPAKHVPSFPNGDNRAWA